jgi:dTDP-4-amino-4,6-dideoxygalactose transaminase
VSAAVSWALGLSAQPSFIVFLMQVPLLDLRSQYAKLKPAVQSAISELCDTQFFVLGPKVEALEEQIAAYSQSRFGIGVSSGTDALLLALMALDIGPGDEVITTPYTFFATAGVVARLNARPVFCDIDPATFNLAPDAVARFIETDCDQRDGALVNRATGGRIRAIMPVHLYGQMADMDALVVIANQYGLKIIEDAAQAIGAELADGRRAGSIGDIGCFSFFPTKNLGAFGDAGMCVTSDAELAEILKIKRVHGGEPKYYHSVIGGNFRLDALQAVVLLEKLKYLDEWTESRQANAAHYDSLFEAADLGGEVSTPVARPGRHIYNQYIIRVKRRDELRAYLSENGIGAEIYYPVSLHAQACFKYLKYPPHAFPESNRAAAETLALPIYPELTIEQREYVVATIARFFAG